LGRELRAQNNLLGIFSGIQERYKDPMSTSIKCSCPTLVIVYTIRGVRVYFLP
jgi:hypothetical protein